MQVFSSVVPFDRMALNKGSSACYVETRAGLKHEGVCMQTREGSRLPVGEARGAAECFSTLLECTYKFPSVSFT